MSIAGCARNFIAAWCRRIPAQAPGGSIDALYVTADQPHQLSLIPDPEIDYGLLVQKKIDAVYVTRFQKERWTEKERAYPKIDAKFLGEAKYLRRQRHASAAAGQRARCLVRYRSARGLFPASRLRRSYPHGADFALLHLHKNKSLHRFAGGFAKPDHPVYAQPIGNGLQCDNPNCITGDPAERQYAANKFYVVADDTPQHCRLRCVYCEKDVDEETANHFVVADTVRKTFAPGLAAIARAAADKLKHLVIYRDDAEAVAAGFQPRETGGNKVRVS